MIARRSSYGLGDTATVTAADPDVPTAAVIGPDVNTIQTMIAPAPPPGTTGGLPVPVNPNHIEEDTIGWNNGPIVKGMALVGVAGLFLLGYVFGGGKR